MVHPQPLTERDILKILETVRDDSSKQDIVTLRMVKGVQVERGEVIFSLEVDPARGPAMEPLRQRAEAAVAALPGVRKVTAVLTAQKLPPPRPSANDPHGMDKNPRLVLPVRKIIAVASGKGGVGKSTVAFNLALALARSGKSVGLLDADIYGPSVPILSGLKNAGKPRMSEEETSPPRVSPHPASPLRGEDKGGGKLIPHVAHGVKVMSMGFMLDDPDAPMIWRGPMVQTALYQMLRDVAWGMDAAPLDVLIIDMPPGTGDAQLTLAQKVDVAGAVIVSTPQDLALIDARKAIAMFRKVHVPILGIIENMSTHICSQCGHEDPIFGHGGARKEAQKLDVPFLGEIPLSAAIRENSDAGRPSAQDVFEGIARALTSQARQS